jgi:hypothetical protein
LNNVSRFGGNSLIAFRKIQMQKWRLTVTAKITLFSIFVLFAFGNSSCNQIQNYLTPSNATDTLRVEADYNPEFIIADPKKIIQYNIRYLSIDNCFQPGSCYHDRYEFNSCGKVKHHIPPMVATSWHFEYDEQCRVISEYTRNFRRTEISYFKQDSILISQYSDNGEPNNTLIDRYKCKVSPIDNQSIYPKDGELMRIDTIGDVARPCGEFFQGPHVKKTFFFDYGLISTIEYYDEDKNLILKENYQYADSLNNPIKFESSYTIIMSDRYSSATTIDHFKNQSRQ